MERSSELGLRDALGRKKKDTPIKERNISGDEFMAASIGDVIWLDQTMKENNGRPSGFDRTGLAPIHLAALHGRLSCIQLLLEKYDEDVNVKSTTGWTALHLCINKEIGTKALKCMNYLLSKGADIDEYNDDNVTPVHQAASEGLYECLKILVEETDLELMLEKDCRGYTALDLARIWGHRNCARLLKNEIWKRKKDRKAREIEQLKTVKKIFSDLQKDAIHQLRNEQEFYGSVAFGNWLAEKDLPENLRNLAMSHIDRYPDASIEGLFKRLQTSGGLEDCAQRLEKGTVKQQNRLASSNRDYQHSKSIYPKTKRDKSGKGMKKEKMVKRVKVKGVYVNSGEENTSYTPFTDASDDLTKSNLKVPWNYSTNVNSKPETNIKCEDIVSMSIHPDDSTVLLPPEANLNVRLATTPETKIRFTMPGGHIKSAGVRMPKLPKKLVTDTLSGMVIDRIRIPQEFKAVHVYDLQKKRALDKPDEEAVMHIQMFGDKKLTPRSTILGSSIPRSYNSTSDFFDTFPPLTAKQGHTRLLHTLDGMNSPQAFLM